MLSCLEPIAHHVDKPVSNYKKMHFCFLSEKIEFGLTFTYICMYFYFKRYSSPMNKPINYKLLLHVSVAHVLVIVSFLCQSNLFEAQITASNSSFVDSALYMHSTDHTSFINRTLSYWRQDLNVNPHLINDYKRGYSTFTINSSVIILTNLPATFYVYDREGDNLIKGARGNATKQPLLNTPIGQVIYMTDSFKYYSAI